MACCARDLDPIWNDLERRANVLTVGGLSGTTNEDNDSKRRLVYVQWSLTTKLHLSYLEAQSNMEKKALDRS